MNEPEHQQEPPKRIPLWPLFYCVSPILIGLGLVLYVNWNKPPTNTSNGPEIPSLGPNQRPLTNAPTGYEPVEEAPDEAQPEDKPADEVENTPDGEKPVETVPEPVFESSGREIDTYIQRLAHAAKVRDSRGITSSRDFLSKANPAKLVDERLLFALQNEQNAFARLALFETFRSQENALSWADSVFTSKYSKYTGDDKNFSQGEQEELLQYGMNIVSSLQDLADFENNPYFTSYLKTLGQTQSPEWAWDIIVELSRRVLLSPRRSLGVFFGSAFSDSLRSGGIEASKAKVLFFIWASQYPSHSDLFSNMIMPTFAPYLVHLFKAGYLDRAIELSGGNRGFPYKLIVLVNGEQATAALVDKTRIILTSDYLTDADMIALIKEVGKYAHGDILIEEGIARQDKYLQYYYAAYGYHRIDKGILKKLSDAANDPNPATAIGAIHGLRQWGNTESDAALSAILEQGSNLAVKSHALGALLERTSSADSRNDLLEEYLDANKSVTLRAVAVGHVPESDIKRLQKIVEEDSSARVRTAALQRIGAISTTLKTKKAKKAMRAWFLKTKDRDSSPVIRSQARKYAKALER